MTIQEAFSLFKAENQLGFSEILKTDPELYEMHHKLTQGTPKHDMIGNHISPGDIVSYSSIGGGKGLSVGVLLGFTREGYRVAYYPYYHNRDKDSVVHTYCMETPFQVTLVRKTNHKY